MPKVYGWSAVKMADHLTQEALLQLDRDLRADPANQLETGPDNIYLYNKKTRRKMEAISWAIYHQQQQKRRKSDEL